MIALVVAEFQTIVLRNLPTLAVGIALLVTRWLMGFARRAS